MPSLVNATFWSTIQRFGGLIIGFVSNIVLARLLCPEDFGIIGLIMVFIGFADALIEGGVGQALIQKKEINQEDISTVFTINLVLSILLFILIFVTAPAIANYVKVEGFSIFLRIEALMLILRAFYMVQFSLINRELEFKKLAKVNLLSSTIATILAVVLAYEGFGVWSLILRNLILDFCLFLFYYLTYKAKYVLYISKKSFNFIFSYGMYVACTTFLDSLYNNALSFVLGKKFSVKELGYYNQAYSLEQIPVYSVTSILNQVFFPLLSKEQDNFDKIKAAVLKSENAMSFFIYPLMVFLICYAKSIIVLLYSEKWLPSVLFFQILCVIGFTNFLFHINRSVLKAVGRPKTLFYTQVVSSMIGLFMVFLCIPLGIYAVVISVSLNSIISLLIVSNYTRKYVGNLFCQIKEVFLNFILSLVAGISSYSLSVYIHIQVFLYLVVVAIIYITIYLTLHAMFNTTSYHLLKSLLIQHYHANRYH